MLSLDLSAIGLSVVCFSSHSLTASSTTSASGVFAVLKASSGGEFVWGFTGGTFWLFPL